MPSSAFMANLVKCHELLRGVQEDLLLGGSRYLAEDIGQVFNNLHRLRQQHDEAIDQLKRSSLAFQAKYTGEKTALEEARRINKLQEGKIRKRDETIEEQDKMIKRLKRSIDENKDGEKTSFQSGYLAAQGDIRTLEAKNQSLVQGVARLKRDLEKAEVNATTSVATAYQKGLADGQQAERNRNRPPPPPPTQPIDILTRERVLNELKLTNTSGHTMSGNLEGAIKRGQRDIVAAVLQFEHPQARAPALHMAALFGDIGVAEVLIQYGADVNESCRAQSENGGHLYGVTPMHLAVGAQHEAMIRLLSRNGAHFSFGTTPSGKRATGTPAFWLISERWLRLTGKADSRDVLRVLRTMKSCPKWNPEAAVDKDGDDLREAARKSLAGRPQLQSAVLEFLNPYGRDH